MADEIDKSKKRKSSEMDDDQSDLPKGWEKRMSRSSGKKNRQLLGLRMSTVIV